MFINRKKAKPITHNGKTQSLFQWSLDTGIGYQTLYLRIYKLKWELSHAFTQPVRQRQLITFRGETLSLNAWAKRLRMPQPTLYQLINKFGCDVEKLFASALDKKVIMKVKGKVSLLMKVKRWLIQSLQNAQDACRCLYSVSFKGRR
jgi:hypothetical protein